MAKAGSGHGSVLGMTVWTLVVQGPPAFGMDIPLAPRLRHDGGTTLCRMFGGRAELDATVSAIRAQGCSVRIMEDEAGVQDRPPRGGPTAWRTVACPSCAFVDVGSETRCGLDDWPPDLVSAVMSDARMSSDAARCPEGPRGG